MSKARMFDRRQLVAAFESIGAAARSEGTRLELAVYGGAAPMLASNFRFATEDVDIAEIAIPWPRWLAGVVEIIAEWNGWSEDWLNNAVTFHLSPLADRAADHIEFGSFPRSGATGLDVLVPMAPYLLARKLKAMRVLDVAKGEMEAADIRCLMQTLDDEGAMATLRRYFPSSAADGGKRRFLLRHLGSSLRHLGSSLRHLGSSEEGGGDAPRYDR